MPGEIVSIVTFGTEVQNTKAIDRQPASHSLTIFAVVLLTLAVIYTLVCFALGFNTRARISTRYQAVREKFSPRKVPRLKEGPYSHGSRCG
jgi:hypothetical protein